MIDPTIEPPFNDRWRGESEATRGDRPGIVASLLRYWVIVVGATLVGAVAGYGVAQLLPVRYQADAVLILSDPGGPSVLGGGPRSGSSDHKVYLDKQSDIMTSTVVLERALELLGSSQSPCDVRDELNVQSSANLASVSIAATSTDPRSAAALANAVGTAYGQVTQERAAADADAAIASLEKLRNRYQADLDASPKSLGWPTYRPSAAAGRPDHRHPAARAGHHDPGRGVRLRGGVLRQGRAAHLPVAAQTQGGHAAGRVARPARGGGMGMVGGRAPTSAPRAGGEPARILEAPLLGEVPRLRAPQVATDEPGTPTALDPALADTFHLIVASMEHELAGVGGKSIAVTSVGPGASKTTTTLLIGNAASQNRKILLIDADVRVRQLSQTLDFAPVAPARESQEPRHEDAPGRWTPVPRGTPPTQRSTSTGSCRPTAAWSYRSPRALQTPGIRRALTARWTSSTWCAPSGSCSTSC